MTPAAAPKMVVMATIFFLAGSPHGEDGQPDQRRRLSKNKKAGGFSPAFVVATRGIISFADPDVTLNFGYMVYPRVYLKDPAPYSGLVDTYY